MLYFKQGELSLGNIAVSTSSVVLFLTHSSLLSHMLKMDGILSDYESTVVTELQCCMCLICTIYESQLTKDDMTRSLVPRFGGRVIL